MRSVYWLCGMGAVGCVTWSAIASAHLDLISPVPREQGRFNVLEITNTNLKEGPCGQRENGRTDKLNVFTPGQTIAVVWDEFVDHSSYYRVAFDREGDDDFPTFSGPGIDSLGDDARDFCPVDGEVILAYEMNDKRGGRYTLDVTLPDVECDLCTLQVVQYMYGRGRQRPYYFQCADIVLQRPDDGRDAGGDSAGGLGGSLVPARDAGGGDTADARGDAGRVERSVRAATSCYQQLASSPVPELAAPELSDAAPDEVSEQPGPNEVTVAADAGLLSPQPPDWGITEAESRAASTAACSCWMGGGSASKDAVGSWGGLLLATACGAALRRIRRSRI